MHKRVVIFLLIFPLFLFAKKMELKDNIKANNNQKIKCHVVQISDKYLNFIDHRNHNNIFYFNKISNLHIDGLGVAINNNKFLITQDSLKAYILQRNEILKKLFERKAEEKRIKKSLNPRYRKNVFFNFGHFFLSNKTNQYKDHYGTNVYHTINYDFEYSHINFKSGVSSEIFKSKYFSSSIDFILYYFNRIDIKINYEIFGSEYRQRNYNYQIKNLFVPLLSLKLKVDLTKNLDELYLQANIGAKTSSADYKLVVSNPISGWSNVDDERDKLEENQHFVYSYGLGFTIKKYLVTLSYSPNLFVFEQYQGDEYWMTGKIFTAKTSSIILNIEMKI